MRPCRQPAGAPATRLGSQGSRHRGPLIDSPKQPRNAGAFPSNSVGEERRWAPESCNNASGDSMRVPRHILLVLSTAAVVLGQSADREPLREARDSRAVATEVTQRVVSVSEAVATKPAVRRNFVDDHIFGKIASDGIPHAPPSGDLEFLRRVQLDLVGRIPTRPEIREFMEDDSSGKRSRKIDELLAREEFSEKWAYFYMDLFRANGKMGRGRELFHVLAEGEAALRPALRRVGAGHHHLGREEQQRTWCIRSWRRACSR